MEEEKKGPGSWTYDKRKDREQDKVIQREGRGERDREARQSEKQK